MKSRLSSDNLMAQQLTWFDVAIIFGPHIPLLLPLTLATLAMSHWTHRLGTQTLGMVETRADHARLSTWYVLLGVMCQQALSVFVFAGARLTGWQAVVGAGVIVCTGCLVLGVIPAAWLLSMQRAAYERFGPPSRLWSCCARTIAGCVRGRAPGGRGRGVGSVVEMRLGLDNDSNRELLLGPRDEHGEQLG